MTSSYEVEKFKIKDFGIYLKILFGDRIAGFLHTINDNIADRAKIENGNSSIIFGHEMIEEKLLGLTFQISMESFFQTNPKCAELLYTKALDYVFQDDLKIAMVVMDLFCRTGTIGQLLSKILTRKLLALILWNKLLMTQRKMPRSMDSRTSNFSHQMLESF